MAKGKEAKKARAPESGIVFPREPKPKPGSDGRGSTFGNQAAFAAALQPVDADVAGRALSERNWRDNYTKFVVRTVTDSVSGGPEAVGCLEASFVYHFVLISMGCLWYRVDRR